MPDEWTPIETAPKDGTVFIGWRRGFVFATTWDNERGGWFTLNHFYEDSIFAVQDDGQAELWRPTHWISMPRGGWTADEQESLINRLADHQEALRRIRDMPDDEMRNGQGARDVARRMIGDKDK